MPDPLGLLGLARKAGRLVLGAAAVEQQLKRGKAALLLLTSDAASHTARHARQWAAVSGTDSAVLPYDKETFGRAVGRRACAVALLTDEGFAEAVKKVL